MLTGQEFPNREGAAGWLRGALDAIEVLYSNPPFTVILKIS
jgi:hypothetical protein